uniref:uncharacterized protein LOC120344849 n=1 Tax=Styela clava TaxID=7725 RepID=UPI00193A07CA|nr:uncharacterized protein LOC120344849 [Styela clava]
MTMIKLILFVFVLIFCQDTECSSQCGKQSLRTNYGLERTFNSLKLDTPSSCKYRIKVPKGLHVKLTFSEYDSDPCCSDFKIYDATLRPFRWKPSQVLALPITNSRSMESPVEVVYKTDVLGIKHDITVPGDTEITFAYEAVVPSDGDCGFTTNADVKSKVIRSPGFPRRVSMSGLDCNWKIKSKPGRAIVLTFTGFRIQRVLDYVEIRDGDEMLGKHDGRLDKSNPIEYTAYSGQMNIRFFTSTSYSNGFKAAYKEIQVNETLVDDSSSTSPVGEGDLKCHRRERMKNMGRAMTDRHTSSTCSVGQVCGRMEMEGETYGMKIWNENANCIPANLCSDSNCSLQPTPPEVTVTSCKLSCCSTNMCNVSPDGPAVPPGEGVSPVSPIDTSDFIKCDVTSEMTYEDGSKGASSSDKPCTADSICALYKFEGSHKDGPSKGKPVTGYAATCALRSECNREACNHIQEAGFIDITSCAVSCCDTDYCNSGSSPVPPLHPDGRPSPIPAGLQCEQSSDVYAGDRSVSGRSGGYSCPANTVCALYIFSGTATQLDGSIIPASGYSAKCAPKSACHRESCDQLYEATQMTFTSCDVSCCETDRCNKPPSPPLTPPIIPPSSGSIDGVTECYEILSSKAGSIQVLNNKKASKCAVPNSSCLRIEAVTASPGGMKADVVYGTCVPTIACESMDCSALGSAMAGMTLESCKTSCCGSNLCNGESESPDSETTLNAGGDNDETETGTKCFDLLQVEAPGIELPGGKKTKTTCDSGSQCLKIVAVATHDLVPSMQVTTTYGSCIPSIACDYMNCDSLPSSMPNVTITSCDVSCCSDDFCNS